MGKRTNTRYTYTLCRSVCAIKMNSNNNDNILIGSAEQVSSEHPCTQTQRGRARRFLYTGPLEKSQARAYAFVYVTILTTKEPGSHHTA